MLCKELESNIKGSSAVQKKKSQVKKAVNAWINLTICGLQNIAIIMTNILR